MEPANILFAVVFIVLPIGIGIWALLTRRSILQRGFSARRRAVSTPQSHERPTSSISETQVTDADATIQIPQRDWASHVRPVRQAVATNGQLNRRRFYPPRYAGRSGGVVKRVTPRAARSFLRPRSGPGR
jgi:hypothetical protein